MLTRGIVLTECMARKRMDLQIFWIVVFAVAFWLGIFFREEVMDAGKEVWNIARGYFA